MINKNVGYIVLMMILLVGKPTFAMQQLVFRGAKLIGKGALPILGGALSYGEAKKYNQFCKDIDAAGNNRKLLANLINNTPRLGIQVFDEPIPKAMEDLLKNRWKKIGNPSLQTLPILIAKPYTFFAPVAALCDKGMVISYDEYQNLNDALLGRSGDNPDKIITEQKIVSLHEISHIINSDAGNQFYVLGIIPVVVETASSGATHLFNKAYPVEVPKTWLKTALRSSAAVGSIIPKLGLSFVGLLSYIRHRETCADRFACENAENRYELEVFRDMFRKEQSAFEEQYEGPDGALKDILLRVEHAKFDLVHPYLGDRADMVQGYLDKMDKKT